MYSSWNRKILDVSWSMYHDIKHIKATRISLFAANLKKGLCMAYGLEACYHSNHSKVRKFPDTKLPLLQRDHSDVPENISNSNRIPIGKRLSNIAEHRPNNNNSDNYTPTLKKK